MRVVMPAMFIRLPARMKKGTASSGNDSMPAIMRCATTMSGTEPETRMKVSEAPAMATATGRPKSINARKVPMRIATASLHEGFGFFQHRVAAPPVLDGHLHRAQRHQCEAGEGEPVDVALVPRDGRHRLVVHR